MLRFNHILFSELFQEYISMFLTEYGEKKSREISDKVNNSSKCNKLLEQAARLKVQVGSDDFVSTVLSSISFSFSNAETISVASLLLLYRWQLETGVPYRIANEEYLNKIFFKIVDKCDKFKTHTSSDLNFFEKFYNKLDIKYPFPAQEYNDGYMEDWEENKLVIPGVGINSIIINETSFNDIETKYGKNYTLINHNNFSFEMYYQDIGLSCYYKQSDLMKKIFFIKLTKLFEAYTNNGIIFDLDSQVTVADIVAYYGRKQSYLSSNGNNQAYLDYNGIMFYVNKADTVKPGEFVYIQAIGII
jgi:hypothetical protein